MIIPTFTVSDIRRAAAFYTEVLDFDLRLVMTPEQPFFAILTRGEDELYLSLPARTPAGRCSATVVVTDIDASFQHFKTRGFSPPNRPESPVHQGPLDQTWGTREVYIDDPDGNTLCFQQR